MSRIHWPRRRQPAPDEGFTLIEVVIAATLSTVVVGVLVAVMLTSLNVADSTNSQLHDSNDLGAVSAFVYRDAQATGGTDPTTARPNLAVGVSTSDPGGCTVAGTLVVRFAWLDQATAAGSTYVATYGLGATGELTRRLCRDGSTVSDVPLGHNITSAVATCAPAGCVGVPTSVSLTVEGSGARSPIRTTLTAAVRPQHQATPSAANSSAVSLLALGDLGSAAPCPVVALAGNSPVTVIGDAVASSACGGSAVSGAAMLTNRPGSTSVATNVNDPLAALVAPVASCPASGPNPAVGSHVADTTAYTVYPDPVEITSTVIFAPGRAVFCRGLTIGAGARVSGTGPVMFYVPGGTFSVSAGATVDLLADATGPYANVLVWVAGGQPVTVQSGPSLGILRGLLYAPRSTVLIDSAGTSIATNIGGIIARTITFRDSGIVRVGPVPNISIAPLALPDGTVGTPYGPVTITAGGDVTAPVSWQTSGLPPALSIDPSGSILGTPSCSGTSDVLVVALDATNAAAARSYTLTVGASAALDTTATTVRSTVNLTATASTPCAGTTSVSFQSKPSASADVAANWTTICTVGTPPFACAWATPAGEAGYYDVRVVAVDATSTTTSAALANVLADNVAPTVSLSSPTPGALLSGLATFSATALDSDAGIADVTFQVAPTGTSNWVPLCNGAETTPAATTCQFDTSALAVGAYDVSVVATDAARCASATVCPTTGNSTTSGPTPVIVGNGAASLTVVPLPPVISGTITVQADAVSAKAFTIAFDYQLGAGGPWVPLACSPVPLGTLYGCPFDTTTVADGALTVRATMVETDPGGATYTATASSTVGNVVVAGYDVQTSNGSSTGKPKKDDVITFTYSTTIDPATILGGWDGTRRSVYVRVSDLSAAGLGAADDDTIDVSANSNFPAVGTTSTSVALGSVDLHSDFVKSGKVVTFKAKMTALTGGSRTVVTITLGDRDEGSSSDLRTSSAKVAMTWTPSSSVTDMSGNACSPSPVDERGALDIDF